MDAADLSRADWRKSSYSAQNGNCIEVSNASCAILVRDTTNRDGATLTVSVDAWQSFTDGLR